MQAYYLWVIATEAGGHGITMHVDIYRDSSARFNYSGKKLVIFRVGTQTVNMISPIKVNLQSNV